MLSEPTSDPPQRMRECVVDLRIACSWLSSCFGGEFVQTVLQNRDSGTDAFGRGAAENNLVGDHVLYRRTVQEVFLEDGRNLLHVRERKLRPGLPLALRFAQHFPHESMRLANRHTAMYH